MRRHALSSFSAVLACLIYVVCAALAYARYPLPYSPSANWLSDLGNRAINVQGAPFYNVGIVITGLLLIVWFLALSHWRVDSSRPQRWLLLLAQLAGALGGISVTMSAVYPIDMFQQHAFWSRAHYMTLAMGFGFSVAAVRYHPRFPRLLLYLGTLAAVSPLASLLLGDVYWLEWVAVGLFLAYVLSVGISSWATRRPARQ
jgi:hypothetical membrane protein